MGTVVGCAVVGAGTAVVGIAVSGPPDPGMQRSPCPSAWHVQMADPALRLHVLFDTANGA